MAGVWISPGWASHPTPKILDRWHRLNLPRLGDWAETQPNNLTPLPRYPGSRYPSRIDPNVVYWPTHYGAFAFGWFLVSGPDLGVVNGAYPTGGPVSRFPSFYLEWVASGQFGPGADSFMLPMYALPEYLMSVPSPDRGVDFYACPVVDARYWANQDWKDDLLDPSAAAVEPGYRMAQLDHLATSYLNNGTLFTQFPPLAWTRNGPAPDPGEPVDMAAVARSSGRWGDMTDSVLSMLGLRPAGVPTEVQGAGAEIQDFERAYETLKAWLDAPTTMIRDGGPALRPDAANLPSHLTVKGDSGRTMWRFSIDELVGGTTGDFTFEATLWLPVTMWGEQEATENPLAREAARRMASRLLSWTLYPFVLRTAGAVRPVGSALVGMWEFGPGYTVAHGLPPDCWWGGGPVPPLHAGEVMFRNGAYRLGAGPGFADPAFNELVAVGSWNHGGMIPNQRYPAVYLGVGTVANGYGANAYLAIGEATYGGGGLVTYGGPQWFGGQKCFDSVGVGATQYLVPGNFGPTNYISGPDCVISAYYNAAWAGMAPFNGTSPCGIGFAGPGGVGADVSAYHYLAGGQVARFDLAGTISSGYGTISMGPAIMTIPDIPLVGEFKGTVHSPGHSPIVQIGGGFTSGGSWSAPDGSAQGSDNAQFYATQAAVHIGVAPAVAVLSPIPCIYSNFFGTYYSTWSGAGETDPAWDWSRYVQGVSGKDASGNRFAGGLLVGFGAGAGGPLSVGSGGTGQSALTSGQLVMGNGTGAVVLVDTIKGGTF